MGTKCGSFYTFETYWKLLVVVGQVTRSLVGMISMMPVYFTKRGSPSYKWIGDWPVWSFDASITPLVTHNPSNYWRTVRSITSHWYRTQPTLCLQPDECNIRPDVWSSPSNIKPPTLRSSTNDTKVQRKSFFIRCTICVEFTYCRSSQTIQY